MRSRRQRTRLLTNIGYKIEHAANVAEAYVRWRSGRHALVLIAMKADPESGALLCDLIKREAPDQLVALLLDGTSLPPTRHPDMVWTSQERPEYFLARVQALALAESAA